MKPSAIKPLIVISKELPVRKLVMQRVATCPLITSALIIFWEIVRMENGSV